MYKLYVNFYRSMRSIRSAQPCMEKILQEEWMNKFLSFFHEQTARDMNVGLCWLLVACILIVFRINVVISY